MGGLMSQAGMWRWTAMLAAGLVLGVAAPADAKARHPRKAPVVKVAQVAPVVDPATRPDARHDPSVPDQTILIYAGRLLADPTTGKVTQQQTLVIERGRVHKLQ